MNKLILINYEKVALYQKALLTDKKHALSSMFGEKAKSWSSNASSVNWHSVFIHLSFTDNFNIILCKLLFEKLHLIKYFTLFKTLNWQVIWSTIESLNNSRTRIENNDFKILFSRKRYVETLHNCLIFYWSISFNWFS